MKLIYNYMKFSNALIISFFIILVGCAESIDKTNADHSILEILDADGDGIINPYEAMDVIMVLEEESGKSLSIDDFDEIVKDYKDEKEAEMMAVYEEMDMDKDGKVTLSEVSENMLDFARSMDADGDEVISFEEVLTFDFEEAFLLTQEEVDEEMKSNFAEYDKNKDDLLSFTEIPNDYKEILNEIDRDSDSIISSKELLEFYSAEMPAKFNVEGNVAFMTGIITSKTPATIIQLLFEHPEVEIIEMINVPGSIDDVANLRASLYVHKFGLSTRLSSKSIVASGGTDFFLAGKKRTVDAGAMIGVHSWAEGIGLEGKDAPKDHPEHKKFIDYYKAIDIPEAFYWYTLEAAPANGIHWMTEDEIIKYNVKTE